MLERRQNESGLSPCRPSAGDDRRVAQRYEAGGTPLLVTWSEADEFRTILRAVKDISLSGIAVLTKEPPPPLTPVWVRLESDRHSEWIGAWVVGVSKSGMLGLGPRILRIRFREACPYDVFKAAIDGFSQEQRTDDVATGRYTRRDWR